MSVLSLPSDNLFLVALFSVPSPVHVLRRMALWRGVNGSTGLGARSYVHIIKQKRVLLIKDKVALRLGRKRSYSSGLELPDGGGDASGVSGGILLYVRQAGGPQRASLFLPLPDSEK